MALALNIIQILLTSPRSKGSREGQRIREGIKNNIN